MSRVFLELCQGIGMGVIACCIGMMLGLGVGNLVVMFETLGACS